MTLLVLAGIWLCAFPAAAQDGFAELCPLLLQQQQLELEDVELAVRLDETRLEVAEEIFVLLDGLWQNDLVGRLLYLGAKHRYDVAGIRLRQTQQQLDRHRAVVEQYRLACSVPAQDEQATDDRRALEEAHDRYLDADCELRALDVALFEVDLEYYQEVLESAADLRQSDIASRQQVLFAEQDVQLSIEQLEQARERVARCSQ